MLKIHSAVSVLLLLDKLLRFADLKIITVLTRKLSYRKVTTRCPLYKLKLHLCD